MRIHPEPHLFLHASLFLCAKKHTYLFFQKKKQQNSSIRQKQPTCLQPSESQVIPVDGKILDGVSQLGVAPQWLTSMGIKPTQFRQWKTELFRVYRGNHTYLVRLGKLWEKNTLLGGGQLKYFLCSPRNPWGNDPIWRAYFSDGLKPPTSFVC